MKNRSQFIAVLGPDGSGKTSALRALVAELSLAGRRTAVFHWRPQYDGLVGDPLPDPHGQLPRPWYQSPVKLVYLWVMFVAGYFLRVRPALRRGDIVLFDRYYHDLLVDPRRYRFAGPMWLARWIGRLVPMPGQWILLDAPVDILRGRKAEVSEEESHRQRAAYRRLAATLNAAIIDTSGAMEVSVTRVRELVLGAGNARSEREGLAVGSGV